MLFFSQAMDGFADTAVSDYEHMLAGPNLKYLTLHDGVPYQTETSPLICRATIWIDFYMIRVLHS